VVPGLQQAAANRFDDVVLNKKELSAENAMKETHG
jgi:hypothetical protein